MPDDLRGHLDGVEALKDEVFEGVLSGIPSEWGATPEELAALSAYLKNSRPVLRQAVTQEFGL
jgi:hypothetical protein